MKNIFKTLLMAIVVTGLVSCENEENFKLLEPQEADFAFITPDNGTAIVLTQEIPSSNPAVTFTWEEVSYGTPTVVTYTLQFATNGTEFAMPIDVASSNATYYSLTVGELNTQALALGLEPGQEGAIDVRVRSTVGTTGSEEKFSNPMTMLVTPFTTELPKIYVVGSFLAASGYGSDWTPASAVPLSSSAFGATDFEGYVYMNVAAPEFKFLPTNTSFDGDYGDDGSFSGSLLQEGEVNAQTTGPAYYRVMADTEALAYSLTSTTWGIIGAATPGGWDNSTSLTYNQETKKWEGIVVMSAAAFKFRANNAWEINLGMDDDGDGSMNYGGPDLMQDTAGTYKVELDLSNPRAYTYTLTLQ